MRQEPSPSHSSRNGHPVRWIVVHTAEGATTDDQLGAFFADPARQVSSHVGIDDREIVQYVDYAEESWAALGANPYADQAELCAFARWTLTDWLTHPALLENAARWIADRCAARGIPPVKVGPADVAAGRPGVIGHVDVTNAPPPIGGGTHQDPGPAFPWPTVMARVRALLATTAAPRTGAVPTVLGEDVPTVLQAAGRAPVLAIGGLFVELHTPAELTNALTAYNKGVTAPDAHGVPSAVWVESATLANLIAQSQQAVRGGAAS